MSKQVSRVANWVDGVDKGVVASGLQAAVRISLLQRFDQSTAAGGMVRFKTVLAHVWQRLLASPLFVSGCRPCRWGWTTPNGRMTRTLTSTTTSALSPCPSRALDLGRPLWALYVIEGLDSFIDLPLGSFAVLRKTQRAAVSVPELSVLSTLLLDDSARPPPEGPASPWFADSAPGRWSLLGRGAAKAAAAPLRLLARMATRVAPAVAALASERPLRPQNWPVTRFSSVVSLRRVLETRRFNDAEVEAVRALVDGATVEDPVLAVCGGALRGYLAAKGELHEGHSLTALVAQPAAAALAARNGAMRWCHLPLGTDIAHALQRLAVLAAEAYRAPDAVVFVAGNPDLADAGALAPAPLLSWSHRLAARVGASLGWHTPAAPCAITEVPEPAVPLYLCGARVRYFFDPLADQQWPGPGHCRHPFRRPHGDLAHRVPRAVVRSRSLHGACATASRSTWRQH